VGHRLSRNGPVGHARLGLYGAGCVGFEASQCWGGHARVTRHTNTNTGSVHRCTFLITHVVAAAVHGALVEPRRQPASKKQHESRKQWDGGAPRTCRGDHLPHFAEESANQWAARSTHWPGPKRKRARRTGVSEATTLPDALHVRRGGRAQPGGLAGHPAVCHKEGKAQRLMTGHGTAGSRWGCQRGARTRPQKQP